MKLFNNTNIRTRLTYWFLLMTLTPLLIVLIITYFQRVSVIETRTFDKLIAIRDLKVERLTDWLSERRGDIYTMSEYQEFTELEVLIDKTSYNQTDINKLSESRRILKSFLNNYNQYNDLLILNPNNGKILVSTKEYMEGENRSDNTFFTETILKKEMVFKDIYFSKALKAYTMTYSIPIFSSVDTKNKIIGVLVAHVDLKNSLFNILSNNVGLGKTGETLIVNKNVLALNQLRWHKNVPLTLKISALPAVSASEGQTGITTTKDYRDIEVLAAYTYIPETSWGFVCKQDMSELNEPIREMIWNFIIIFIISLIIIAFVAITISGSISQPIKKMHRVALELGSGNLSARNIITSKDELGMLAEEFNNMASMISSRIKIQQEISGISDIMIGQSSLLGFADLLLKQFMNTTGAVMSTFYILNENNEQYELFTSIAANKEMLKTFSSKNPAGEFGNVLLKKQIYHLQNIPENTVFQYQTTAGDLIPNEIITIPVLVENVVVAIISLVSINKFTRESIDIIEHSWAAINSSYSNLLAGERTMILAEQLSRINSQLEDQSKVLREQKEALHDRTEKLQHSSEDLHQQNIELEQQRARVEEANKLKSEFLSNMSHELRTPLNSINALSQVLIMQTETRLDEEETSYLEIIARNGKRLLSLINDILDLSKIEAGKIEIFSQKISVRTLLTNVKEILLILAENKGISVILDIPENIPAIETDEAKLYQVLTNVAGNAVKFTKEGNVTISTWHKDENIFIKVKDTGIGIQKHIIPFIFDEFRQADGSSAREHQGTGLGLAIAKKMIEVLGGNINVESKVGVGSTFTIKIPLSQHSSTILPSINSIETEQPKSSEKTILVIDDDPKVIKNISEYLTSKDFKVVSATSGKEGLKMAEKFLPHAITLDILMPEMDGWEVLQNLKSNLKTKDIPVIIVSVLEDKDTGFALGAIGFINKPIDKNTLIAEIKNLKNIPHSVLIVDDDEFVVKEMKDAIESENINTIIAHNGEECLNILTDTIPDIMILDILMPGMDGFQVLDKIRLNPATQNLPVIIVTAKDITREDRKRLRGNIASVIAKSDTSIPFLNTEIERIINEIKSSNDNSNHNKTNTKPLILIVEDNKDNMTIFKAILRDDYSIIEAYDGEEGLRMAKERIPDLIVLDIGLPKLDGFKVVGKVRKHKKTRNIPVIAVTANVMIGDREKILKAGCDDYLAKPIDPEKFKELLSTYLSV